MIQAENDDIINMIIDIVDEEIKIDINVPRKTKILERLSVLLTPQNASRSPLKKLLSQFKLPISPIRSPTTPSPREKLPILFGVVPMSPIMPSITRSQLIPTAQAKAQANAQANAQTLFNKDPTQLKISSLNCGYKIIDPYFYKVQLRENADPLINEVIFTKILNNYQYARTPKIFPDYVDHFISANKKVLVLNYLQDSISLIDYIKDKDKDILTNLNKLFMEYSYYGKTLGFIHGDLHFNNIQFSNNQFYIIDFGRCFVHTKFYDELLTKENTLFTNFGIEQNSINLISPAGFTNNPVSLTTDNLNEYNIGFLCDIGSVSLNLIRSNILIDKFLNITVENNVTVLNVLNLNVLKFNLIKDTPNTPINHGVAWIICYINACIYDGKKGNFIVSIGSITKEELKIIKFFKLKLNFVLNMTLFTPSGIIMPPTYKDPNIKQATIQNYLNILTSIGGNKQKLKSNKLKAMSKKMQGGNYDPEQHDYFKNYIGIPYDIIVDEYINEIDGFIDQQISKTCPIGSTCPNEARVPLETKYTKGIPAGGNTKKSYIIHTCKESHRKYIRKANKRWYIDENRGKYRYIDDTKKKITIK
jgi:hypothetical protein